MKKTVITVSAVTLSVLLAVLAVRWVERKGMLDLRLARIDNSGPVDSVLVAEILRPWFGRSLLDVDCDSLTLILSGIEGVRAASVVKSYPDMLIVSMEIERPAALIRNGATDYPVTSSGLQLPSAWASDSLPVLTVTGSPGEGSMESGLRLLLKRSSASIESIEVTPWAIVVRTDGRAILFDGCRAVADWKTWAAIRDGITCSGMVIDLRYTGQAVLRSVEESGV
jgi:hypothetical protein